MFNKTIWWVLPLVALWLTLMITYGGTIGKLAVGWWLGGLLYAGVKRMKARHK